MKMIRFIAALLALGLVGCNSDDNGDGEGGVQDGFRPVTATSSKWISKVLEYRPAPGQFVNTSIGAPEAAQSIVGKKGTVTLGAWGGYIAFQFDHTVVNEAGDDFAILGNAFDGNSEPGIVMVAFDRNGNGVPDADEWYELAGSEHQDAQTVKNYRMVYYKPASTTQGADVVWKDNQGQAGAVHLNEFHAQSYYPLFGETGIADSIVFTGTRLPGNATQGHPVYGSEYWVMNAFEWGYADNFSVEYEKGIGGEKYANGFDISKAVDTNGKSVELKGIDFVKVYTGLNQEQDPVGEISTEICGAISLSVKK